MKQTNLCDISLNAVNYGDENKHMKDRVLYVPIIVTDVQYHLYISLRLSLLTKVKQLEPKTKSFYRYTLRA